MKFSFSVVCCDPAFYGGLHGPDPYPWPEDATVQSLQEHFYELVCATGFYERTSYAALYLTLSVVSKKEKSNEILFQSSKKHNSFTAVKTFYGEDIFPKLTADYEGTMSQIMLELLSAAAVTLKLDTSSLDQRVSAMSNSLDIPIVVDEHEEVALNISLKDLAEIRDMTSNGLIDVVDAVLKEAQAGRVDATEIGQGFQTIFCVGGDTSEILRLLEPVLARIPRGSSFAEVRKNGICTKLSIGNC